ncbi:hypothetical protein G6F59_017929 [Rhizopus arrhizus]|nr:hypothetical protein G6F59_017929 [Rhizopus arrhizus]
MRAFLLEILHVGLALGYLALDEDVAGAVAGVARKLPVALLLRSSGNRVRPVVDAARSLVHAYAHAARVGVDGDGGGG